MIARPLAALLALSLLGSVPSVAPRTAPPVPATAAPPTVVILVRHAEKAAEPAADPPLTEAGSRRAEALVQVARDAGVGAVVTTQFARTRLTAQPVAQALGVAPSVVAAGGTTAAHAQAVADEIRTRYSGRTVLVVGHSNTIPAIIGALGAPRPSDLCDAEYDALFVVVLGDDGKGRLVRSRYGAPSDLSTCQAMR